MHSLTALFTIGKTWKQPKCPSTDEWIKKTWHILLLLFSHSVMSDSLWPHGLQHARLPCPSLSLKVFSNSCPLSQCCYLIISSPERTLLLLPWIFPSIRVFPNKSSLHIRWPKYWSFSFIISPSNEYSGLISFRIDYWSPCSPRDSQESSPTPQFKSINSLVLKLLYGPTLISVYDYWKKP